ncbi:MAG: hypothetical protein WC890_03030 [Candidatus Margulisiibacteriota bacterium]
MSSTILPGQGRAVLGQAMPLSMDRARTSARLRFAVGERLFMAAPAHPRIVDLHDKLIIASARLVQLMERYNAGEDLLAVQIADLSMLSCHRGDFKNADELSQEACRKDPANFYPIFCRLLYLILSGKSEDVSEDQFLFPYLSCLSEQLTGVLLMASICGNNLSENAQAETTSSQNYQLAKIEILRIAARALSINPLPFSLWMELMDSLCILSDRNWLSLLLARGKNQFSVALEGGALLTLWPATSVYYELQIGEERRLCGELFGDGRSPEAEDFMHMAQASQERYSLAVRAIAARTLTRAEADDRFNTMLATRDENDLSPADFEALRIFGRLTEFKSLFSAKHLASLSSREEMSLILIFQFYLASGDIENAKRTFNMVADAKASMDESTAKALQNWALRIIGELQEKNDHKEVLTWGLRALKCHAQFSNLKEVDQHGLFLAVVEACIAVGKPQISSTPLQEAIPAFATNPSRQLVLRYLAFVCFAATYFRGINVRNVAAQAADAAQVVGEAFGRGETFSLGVRISEWEARRPLRALFLVRAEQAKPEDALAGMIEVPVGVDPFYYHFTRSQLLADAGQLRGAKEAIGLALAVRPAGEETLIKPGHCFPIICNERKLAEELMSHIDRRIDRVEKDEKKAAAAALAAAAKIVAEANAAAAKEKESLIIAMNLCRDNFLRRASSLVARILGEGAVYDARQNALYSAGQDFEVAIQTESFDAAFSRYQGSRTVLGFSAAVEAAIQSFGIREVSITATEEANGGRGLQRRLVVRLTMEDERYFEIPLAWTASSLQFPVPGRGGTTEWAIHCFLNAAILETILAELENEVGQYDLVSDALQKEPAKPVTRSAPVSKPAPAARFVSPPVWQPPVTKVISAPLSGSKKAATAPLEVAPTVEVDPETKFLRAVRDRFETLLLRVMEKRIDYKGGSEARKVAVNDLARYLLDYLRRRDIVGRSFSAATTQNLDGIVADVVVLNAGTATKSLTAWGLIPEKVTALKLDEKGRLLIRLCLTGEGKNDVFFVLDLQAATADILGFRAGEVEDEFVDNLLEVALQAIGVGAIPALACLHRAIQHPGPEDWKGIIGDWARSTEASDGSLSTKAFAALAPELTARKVAPTFREAIPQLALRTMETAIAAGKIPVNALFFIRQRSGIYRVASTPEEKMAMLRDYYADVQIVVRPPIPVNLPPYFSNGSSNGVQLQPKEADSGKLSAAVRMGLDLTAGAAVFVATHFGEGEGRIWRRLSVIRPGVIVPAQISKRALLERDFVVSSRDLNIGLLFHPSVPEALAKELVAQETVQAAIREWQNGLAAGRIPDELGQVEDAERRNALANIPITGMSLCVLPVGRTFIDPQSTFIKEMDPQAQRALKIKYGVTSPTIKK